MLPIIISVNADKVYASDYSEEMLSVCRENYECENIEFSKQDIYSTHFKDNELSIVLSSRFLFHCDDQKRLFSEFKRIVEPGGCLIMDSLRWSPRTWTSMFKNELGGEIYTNSSTSIRELARLHGFEVVDSRSILALPSFFYNFIPRFLISFLTTLESIWPDCLKTKQVWMLRKYE